MRRLVSKEASCKTGTKEVLRKDSSSLKKSAKELLGNDVKVSIRNQGQQREAPVREEQYVEFKMVYQINAKRSTGDESFMKMEKSCKHYRAKEARIIWRIEFCD